VPSHPPAHDRPSSRPQPAGVDGRRCRALARAAALATGLGASACAELPAAPAATITATAPRQLAPADDARDDVELTVAYSDGDGDLGGGAAILHDCRSDRLRAELPLPAIAPPAVAGAAAIRGVLALHVVDVGAVAAADPPAACRELAAPALAPQEVAFCIELMDAAGHVGPGDCTPVIELIADAPAP
jgi:hypothetical protein